MSRRELVLFGFPEADDETAIPTQWEICSSCRGNGTSSAYLGAFTREDLDDAGPEFIEDYIAGAYDRACDCCGGSGKVIVPDRRAMSAAMLKAWDAQAQQEADDRAAERQEYLVCGGWREEYGH